MYPQTQTTFPDLPHEGYRQALQAWRDAVAAHEETRQEVGRLQGTRANGTWPDGQPKYVDGELAEAIAADNAAQATAMRTGEKDPGRKNTQRVAKALQAAQERVGVQAEMVTQTYLAIFDVLREHREEVLAAVDEAKEARRIEYRDAVNAVEAARSDFYRMDDMRAWVSDPSRRYKTPERRMVTMAFRLRNGEPPQFDLVMQGMRDEVEPPEPVQGPSHYKTVTEAITSPGGQNIGTTYRTIPVYEDGQEVDRRQVGPGLNIGGVPVYTGEDG